MDFPIGKLRCIESAGKQKGVQKGHEVQAIHSVTSVSRTLFSAQMLGAYLMEERGQCPGSNRRARHRLWGGGISIILIQRLLIK